MEWQNPGCTEEECYRRLRDAIIDGTLMPSQRLVEAEVAQWLGVSRATVRTVLARLEQEHLVERERHRGARVRHVSSEEAIEILEVRIALECLVVRYAAIRAKDEDFQMLHEILVSMRENYEAFDFTSCSEDDVRFHNLIATISGHRIAYRLLVMLNSFTTHSEYR